MKQKIVIKVCTMCCDKCRSKAMALAAAACGVESVALDGKHGDELVVVGDCVDAVKLTTALRKKLVGRAELLEVTEVKPKKDDDKKPPPPPKPPANPPPPPPPPPPPVTFVCHHCRCHPVGYLYYNYSCPCYCHFH